MLGCEESLELVGLVELVHAHGPVLFTQLFCSVYLPQKIMRLLEAPFPEGLALAPLEAQWEYVRHFLIRRVYVRPRLFSAPTASQVRALLATAARVLVVAGAGISVNCGIPDFRSPQGLYERVSRQFPDLPSPEAIFDIAYFRENPRPFYAFAKALLPQKAHQPSPTHRWIRALEEEGRLLRMYTQNIDTLEEAAGIRRVVYCHGSFRTCTCTACGQHYAMETLKRRLAASELPRCAACAAGLLKPDIVFFGEALPAAFDACIREDIGKADLLLVIGSSMKVHPVSDIPDLLPPHVPQILVNKHLVDHTFDFELIGCADAILPRAVKLRALPGEPPFRLHAVE